MGIKPTHSMGRIETLKLVLSIDEGATFRYRYSVMRL